MPSIHAECGAWHVTQMSDKVNRPGSHLLEVGPAVGKSLAFHSNGHSVCLLVSCQDTACQGRVGAYSERKVLWSWVGLLKQAVRSCWS